MDWQHLNVKFFVEDPQTVDLAPYTAVFDRWIQEKLGDGLLIDVADYRHVPDGPGVVLIGHEANYSLDNAGGRLGLLYNRKAPVTGSTADRLAQAVRAALLAAQRLAADPGLRVSAQSLQLIVNDRLLAPNTPETLAEALPELTQFFDALYGPGAYTLERRPDPRERLTLDIRAHNPIDVAGLLARLPAPEAA
ncbi:MAG: hypothetical protein ABI847_19490 [Anaerolineales bacterium]